MTEWDQPHWSGRPQPQQDRKPPVQPNGFARFARACARRPAAVLLTAVFFAAMSLVYGLATIRLEPYTPSRIALDAQTLAAQERLAAEFPGLDRTFVATIENDEPEAARAASLSLAAALLKRRDLFVTAFVPGTGPYYDRFGFLFRDTADIEARVAQALQMQPLYQAISQAPDLGGLAVLVTEIGKAVGQGRSPAGLSALLFAVAESVEGELANDPRPVQWRRLAGLAGDIESGRWLVIAVPVESMERQAADFARASTDTLKGAAWSFPPQLQPGLGNIVRDLIVPAIAALLVVVTVLGVGLGPPRYVATVLAATATVLCLAAGPAAIVAPALDSVTWSFAAACLAPVLLFSLILVLAHVQARVRGATPLAAIAAAAHRRGALVLTLAAALTMLWGVWQFHQLPSLALLGRIAAVGTALALLVSMTVVPALLAVADRAEAVEPHWLDTVAAAPLGSNGRNALQLLVLVLIAAAVFCAVFIPSLRFADALPPGSDARIDSPVGYGAVHLLAPDAAEIQRLVAAVTEVPETRTIRTVDQFLPAAVDLKLNALKQLENYLDNIAQPREPPAGDALALTFGTLAAGLKQIADEAATSPDLRDSALRLRRALALYTNPAPLPPERVAALERSLFSGLTDLAAAAQQLARLPAPAVSDIDEGLRRMFVSPKGMLRIEILPKPEAGRLGFAAALRKIDPLAAGTPIVALARNEVIHHEAARAIALALAAAAVLLLLLLRNVVDWLAALVPAGLALCLSAAVSVGAGLVLTSAALGAAMTAIGLTLASATVLVLRARQPSARVEGDTALRTALLPPLVVLAAVAPLALSGMAPVAATGRVMILFLLISAAASTIITPQLCHWIAGLRRR